MKRQVTAIIALLLMTAAGAAAGLVDVAASANGGTASQSSTHYALWGCGYNGVCGFSYDASLAIDGNTDQQAVFAGGSVAVTSNTSNPWWEVVFSGNYAVQSIDVYTCTNCADAAQELPGTGNPQTLSFFLLDQNNATVWSQTGVAANPLYHLSFTNPGGVSANGLLIQLDGTDALGLAEVVVMSDTGVPEPSTLMLLGAGALLLAIRRR